MSSGSFNPFCFLIFLRIFLYFTWLLLTVCFLFLHFHFLFCFVRCALFCSEHHFQQNSETAFDYFFSFNCFYLAFITFTQFNIFIIQNIQIRIFYAMVWRLYSMCILFEWCVRYLPLLLLLLLPGVDRPSHKENCNKLKCSCTKWMDEQVKRTHLADIYIYIQLYKVHNQSMPCTNTNKTTWIRMDLFKFVIHFIFFSLIPCDVDNDGDHQYIR